MKFKWDRRYFILSINLLLVSCASILFYFFILNIGNIFGGIKNIIKILNPIILGLCLAYLLNPLLNIIEDFLTIKIINFKNNKHLLRVVSMIITYSIVIIFLVLFLYIILPQLISTITYILDNFPKYIDNLNYKAKELSIKHSFISTLIDKMLINIKKLFDQTHTLLGDTLPKIYDIAKNITLGLLNIFLGLVISIYLLAKKELYLFQTKKCIAAFCEKSTMNMILTISRSIHNTFNGFITGKIVDSAVVGVICFISMTIFRFPFAPLISVLIGLTNMIPYFGPFIGALPSVLLIVVANPIKGILFAIFIIVLQQFDGNYLGPKIIGSTTGLSPFWIIFSITIFGGLFGVIGMFIGVPIFAIIYSIIKSVINNKLKAKNLNNNLIENISER